MTSEKENMKVLNFVVKNVFKFRGGLEGQVETAFHSGTSK